MRVVVLVVVAALGCVDRGPGPEGKKVDPAYVAQHLVKAVPDDASKLEVVLGGGALIYAGNTIDKPATAPGQTVRITHYWRVIAPVGPGWTPFALLRGAANTADFMNLPATDMALGHPPATWQAGEIIEDVQDLTLRPDWRSPTATLTVGLIATGAHGPGDRMAASGPNTVDRAVIARSIVVDLARAPAPPGTIYIPRASGPIAIDGAGSEPAWQTAVTSPELVTAEGSRDPVGKAIAKLLWDDDYLYAFVSVTDSDIVSEYKNHDDPMWKQDCLELFIDADGNQRGYIELQVNPNNATFDKWYATTRAAPGDEKWDSGMQTAVRLRGTATPGDTDQGWDAELAIPWAAVRGRDDAMAVRLPPQVGDRWRLNLVRVDVRTGDKGPQASSWNRISSADFHALDRMLTAVFADTSGAIVTQPAIAKPDAPKPAEGK
ncbi:MAG TPA: carbohydrate-binding family 9-like protein [Kofleriaceae bacterium]